MHSAEASVSGAGGASTAKINILGAITKPLTKRIVQVSFSRKRERKKMSRLLIPQIDKAVLKCWGTGGCQEERLLKVWCEKPSAEVKKNIY